MYLYGGYEFEQRERRVAKSQAIRVLDVAVIGPLMIWGGVKAGGVAGVALALFGATTMGYNAVNYLRVERGEAC